MTDHIRIKHRANAIFSAGSEDFLLREQLASDPASVLYDYVFGERLSTEDAQVANHLLQALLSNQRSLSWLGQLACQQPPEQLTTGQIANALAAHAGRNGDRAIAAALLHYASQPGASLEKGFDVLKIVLVELRRTMGPRRRSTGTEHTPVTGTGHGTEHTPVTGTGHGTEHTPVTERFAGTEHTPVTGTGHGTEHTPVTGTGHGTEHTPVTGHLAGTEHTPVTGTGHGTEHTPVTGTGHGTEHTPVTGTGHGTEHTPVTGTGHGTEHTPITGKAAKGKRGGVTGPTFGTEHTPITGTGHGTEHTPVTGTGHGTEHTPIGGSPSSLVSYSSTLRTLVRYAEEMRREGELFKL